MPSEKGATAGHNKNNVKGIKCDLQNSAYLGNYIEIKVGGLKHFALIDSGSDLNVLSSDVLSDFSNVSFQRSESDRKYIVTANNEKSPIDCMLFVHIDICNVSFRVKFYVVQGLTPNIILRFRISQKEQSKIRFWEKRVAFRSEAQYCFR